MASALVPAHRFKRSLVASTSASTLIATPARPKRQQNAVERSLFPDANSSGSRKGRGRLVKREAALLIFSAAALLQSMPLAHGHDNSHTSLQARSSTDDDSSTSDKVRVSHNLPIQLVIILGCIVLFAMFVTALACLFRSSSSRSGSKSAREDSFTEVVGARKKNAWSPGGTNSIYTYSGESMGNSTDSLSIGGSKREKDNRRKSGSALSPVSPMPALKDEQEHENGGAHLFYTLPGVSPGYRQPINMPIPAAISPRSRSNGWQLYDNPVPLAHDNSLEGDVEAAGLGPGRRPSFIDRLLAHRADPNDARLPNGQLAADPDGVPRLASSRKVSGSAIFSALNPLRSRDNSQKRLDAVESDFEGSIGGRDGEIPMAKRIRHSQGRIAFDEATIAAASPSAPHRLNCDRFSPLPERFFPAQAFRRQSTPLTPSAMTAAAAHTPGLAGVGASWNRLSDPTIKTEYGKVRVPTFAELQRQQVSPADAHRWKMQTTIDQWVRESIFAGMPPPSRRGSSASFLTVGGASHFTTTATTIEGGLERVPSLRPHFAATTTLASWLNEDHRIDEQSEGEHVESIVENYLKHSKQSAVAGVDSDEEQEVIWEGHMGSVARPPSYHSQMTSLHSSSSVDGTMGHVHGQDPDEQLMEEEKRRLARHQRHVLKEKRRAERRLVRQQRESRAHLEDSVIIQQQPNFVMDMIEPTRLCGDEIVAQSKRPSSKIILADRVSCRTPLSEPESPLTSASEGPSRSPRRRSEQHFLVPSSRSRSSVHSGSQRSVSHSVVHSQQDPLNDRRRLAKKQSHDQLALRSVSERPSFM